MIRRLSGSFYLSAQVPAIRFAQHPADKPFSRPQKLRCKGAFRCYQAAFQPKTKFSICENPNSLGKCTILLNFANRRAKDFSSYD